MKRSINLNPKLLISDYCDSVIREIDIEIEQRLKKYYSEQDQYTELNRDRDEMIGEVKKAENEIFEYYESIRKDETIKELLSDKIGLERKLFANKSILFIPKRSYFNGEYMLLIFDFYINQAQKDLLRYFLYFNIQILFIYF